MRMWPIHTIGGRPIDSVSVSYFHTSLVLFTDPYGLKGTLTGTRTTYLESDLATRSQVLHIPIKNMPNEGSLVSVHYAAGVVQYPRLQKPKSN